VNWRMCMSIRRQDYTCKIIVELRTVSSRMEMYMRVSVRASPAPFARALPRVGGYDIVLHTRSWGPLHTYYVYTYRTPLSARARTRTRMCRNNRTRKREHRRPHRHACRRTRRRTRRRTHRRRRSIILHVHTSLPIGICRRHTSGRAVYL
jgi:hypothetical protein